MAHKRRDDQTSKIHLSSATLILVVILAFFGALLYLNFLLNPVYRGDLIPYVLLVIAETFLVSQALCALWTILAGNYNPRNFEFHHTQEHLLNRRGSKSVFKYPHDAKVLTEQPSLYINSHKVTVDVFIPVFGEPIEVIRKTIVAASSIYGKHTTYVLDDGKSDEVQKLAKQLNVKYVRRPDNLGAKAGNINYALKKTSADFFVILDADFIAKSNFLFETLPFFENKNIAFVQTPQAYSNMDHMISRGAGYMQNLFYQLIQPGKNRFNAAFCVGTNVIFRRSAVDAIGGIYSGSKSEDIWTSILLHEHGYDSIFIQDVLAVGQTPDTIKAYSKQQLRWATGGFEILLKHNPLVKRLTLDQKLQYFITVSYYLQGFAIMLLLSLPVIHIFFNWSPVDINLAFATWLGYYLSFYGLQILLAFYAMGGFKLDTLILSVVSFPIYIKAFINALTGRDEAWQATGSVKRVDSPFNYIIPQMLIFVFLLFTCIVGIWKTYYYESLSVSLFWVLLNTSVFGTFIAIAIRENAQLKRESRKA